MLPLLALLLTPTALALAPSYEPVRVDPGVGAVIALPCVEVGFNFSLDTKHQSVRLGGRRTNTD